MRLTHATAAVIIKTNGNGSTFFVMKSSWSFPVYDFLSSITIKPCTHSHTLLIAMKAQVKNNPALFILFYN